MIFAGMAELADAQDLGHVTSVTEFWEDTTDENLNL